MNIRQAGRGVLLTLLLAAGAAAGAAPAGDPARAALVGLNAGIFEHAVAEDGLLTLKGVRTAAMSHLAAYRALARHGEDAMMTAACDVAAGAYPALEPQCGRWLDGEDEAAAAGRSAARELLEARSDDGWNAEVDYQWHPMAPGVYAEFNEHSGTPEGFVFGAGWARARGFALRRPDELRSPPPPDVGSSDYARAFDEVKRVGRFQTLDRTPDQTHLALWWKDFVENSHNRLARDLVVRHDLPLGQSARLFALLNAAVFDAYVSSFENKFFYNHWRPYTAIRWAANDGNPDTRPEPTWNNTHLHTYAFPSYPSAHGSACGAAMTVLADAFGENMGFSMTTSEVDVAGPGSQRLAMLPPSRSFDSFAAAARECADSRIYLGIHFRYDSDAGLDLGRQVGKLVLERLSGP